MLLTIYIIGAVITAIITAVFEMRSSRRLDDVDFGSKLLMLGMLWPLLFAFGAIMSVLYPTTLGLGFIARKLGEAVRARKVA